LVVILVGVDQRSRLKRAVASKKRFDFGRHPGESRDPCAFEARSKWIPAFTGMTVEELLWFMSSPV
jgi:hypothetical protein